MVLMAEPLAKAIKSVKKKGAKVVYLSPQGARFNDKAAKRLSALPRLVLVCGRYEGVDERVMSFFDEELSIGDYVLSGGELPAMVVADAVTRLLPGVFSRRQTRPRMNRSRPASWIILSIRGRGFGNARPCRTFCSPAITRRSHGGKQAASAATRRRPDYSIPNKGAQRSGD